MLNILANMGLKSFLNGHKTVRSVAEVLDISLKNGRGRAKILLNGETEPVAVSLDYKVDGDALCVTNVDTSRKWLNGLAEMFKDRYARIDLGKYEGVAAIAKHLL